jgi:hypothetical protein
MKKFIFHLKYFTAALVIVYILSWSLKLDTRLASILTDAVQSAAPRLIDLSFNWALLMCFLGFYKIFSNEREIHAAKTETIKHLIEGVHGLMMSQRMQEEQLLELLKKINNEYDLSRYTIKLHPKDTTEESHQTKVNKKDIN